MESFEYGKGLLKYLTLLALSMVFWATASSAAELSEIEAGPFEFEARIMAIDLDNNLLVIAEEDIFLRSSILNGKKVWKTKFTTMEGNAVSVNAFQLRDRVLVKGNKSLSGVLTADSIEITASTDQIGKDKKKENTGPNLPPKGSSTIYKEDGVWKN